MDMPPKKNTQKNETPTSKSRLEASSSSDPNNVVEPLEDESTSNEEVEKYASLGKEASTEMELPKYIMYDWSGTNPVTSIASPYGRDITDHLLSPYVPTQNAYGFTEGSGLELQMYDNVQGNDETRYWESLISDASEILNCKSLNDSEVYRRLMMKRPSTSEASGTGVGMQTMPPDLNNEPQSSDYEVNSGAMNHSPPRIDFAMSPKEKRVKLNPGEGESWKLCNCKMSKCLKLYCACFTARVYCTDLCSCVDCFNRHIHKDTVLATHNQIESQNTLVFAPQVIKSSDSALETRDDSSKSPAPIHNNCGCICKLSNCQKKCCGCYKGGVGCSIKCTCEGCLNIFGRNDAATLHKHGCFCKLSKCQKKCCGCYKSGVGCSIKCTCEGCLNKFGRNDG